MQNDIDLQETEEWRQALASLVARAGPERARFILDELSRQANDLRLGWRPSAITPYVNTIAVEQQPVFPGDLDVEQQLASLMRWNALAMVVRANRLTGELGGHIASYASAADLFEVGFNHFWRSGRQGDLVFMQAHSAPGVYARAYLEGRLTESDLTFYRRELAAKKAVVLGEVPAETRGLSSYPHPHLMPDFWQFPTASMGLGPVQSIYQARFMRYLTDRGQHDCTGRRVWGIFGDGEMDEPESMSALTMAAREGLDNLTWVVNCNLQRLDGPVRGNGRIIDELETLFIGAGWRVIKLIWGSDWDGLFARDSSGVLAQALAQTVDGQMQTFAAKDGRFNRENFFGQHPALAALVQGMTDEQIDGLKRGGHDMVKIHAAYAAAMQTTGQPTVILAHTKKGYGMGQAGQGRMTTHSNKKLEDDDLLAFRDRFGLPLSDEQVLNLAFFKPDDQSPVMRYLRQRRESLGGGLPLRQTQAAAVKVPAIESHSGFALSADGKEMSTTMAFVRQLGALLKDPELGPRIVPIVADEARTFGMANLFKQVGIYSSVGQRYAPEDIGSVLSYREAKDGQILEEGISEAGAISSWIAAATSYAVHGQPMVPFYIFYSMFGFQRIGDLIWAGADQNPRGFLLGATSGRTTLAGEGLQHQDGTSLLWASTVPNCRSYDPAFAGELAVLIQHGLQEMLVEQRDVFYYVTMTNANYAQPSFDLTQTDGVVKGGYLLKSGGAGDPCTIFASGAIMTEALEAFDELIAQGRRVYLFSITSYCELAREHQALHLQHLLSQSEGPVVAVSDWVRAVPDQIRALMPANRSMTVLATDGFGCSDTRAALREQFGINSQSIVRTALGLAHNQDLR
jgi:pyruvate dehydrogenase E1 component